MGSDGHMCNGFCMGLIKQMNPGEILGSDGQCAMDSILVYY